MSQRVAAGSAALSERLRATFRAVLGHDRLLGGTLGIAAGAAATLLLWQSFWHGFMDRGLAIAVTSALGAVLLAVPLRALAGAFASTLSLAITALAVFFFATSPAGVQAGTGPEREEPLGQEVVELTGSPSGSEIAPAPVPPAPAPEQAFGHAVYEAPVASRSDWEPATPCHSRLRTWPGHGDRLAPAAKGPCELLPPPPE